MRSRNLLLRFIAKAVVNSASGGLPIGDFLVDVLPEIARDAHAAWIRWRSVAEQRADIEDVILISDERASLLAAEFAAEVAADQPAGVRQLVADYLATVPATIRSSLEERSLAMLPALSSAASGREDTIHDLTIPPEALPQSADDLIQLLNSSNDFSPSSQFAETWDLTKIHGFSINLLESSSVDDETNYSDPRDAFRFVNRGLERRGKGELDEAIGDYNQALRIDPQYALAYRCRGDTHKAQNYLRKAVLDFSRAIEIDSMDALAYRFRGIARAAQGDLDGALEDFDKAININPKDFLAFVNRGIIRETEGKYRCAIDDYSQAIDINSKDANLLMKRGQARQMLGDLEGSLADFIEVCRLSSIR